jgi:hypothetical protein
MHKQRVRYAKRIKMPVISGINPRFELEFHSEFWILTPEFRQNMSLEIGSINKLLKRSPPWRE